MKKKVPFSFHQRVLIIFLLTMLIPFGCMGYIFITNLEETMLAQKENYLLGFTKYLDTSLDPGGYQAILEKHNAQDASREEKIGVLNKELSAIADDVAQTLPGLGIGHYSLELDAILTYGPSTDYGKAVGRPISPGHPGREVMRTNKDRASFGTMVRGNILNAMHPVVRGGKVIGYIWANELTADIKQELAHVARTVIIVLLLCCIASIGLFTLISRRALQSVDTIIESVNAMGNDLSRRIPDMPGEMGQVAASINDMAGNIQKTSEETRISAAVLQNITNNVDSMIYVVDPKTRELVYANNALRKWAGRDDLTGKVCHEVLFHTTGHCANCLIDRLFDDKGKPLDYQVEEDRHDEDNRDYRAKGRIILWPDNREVCMIVSTDVTEHNALTRAEAANVAQKEFLSRMSHELRTPMNGVLGMTHLALQADPPPKQQKYLKKIQSSASLLLGIINDILDFSRIEAGRLELENRVFNLHTAIQNIRELVLPRIQDHQVTLTIKLEPSVPEYVSGDELRLSQILLNLLGNSAKFTSEGGVTLTISAQPIAHDKIRIHCEVRDTGIGMSCDEQKLLFKPFSQTNVSITRKFGGTGLGLAISKTLVELMGGAIGVSSSPDKGSVFSFFVVLGVAEDGAPIDESDVSVVTQQRYDDYKFLLVEDNEINQEIATELLSNMGINVDVAGNGEEGVNAFLRKDYDIIFMDVRMPVMGGLEATKRIRSSSKHDATTVPIIAMTANAMAEDRELSMSAGMNSHLAKPLNVLALQTIIYQYLIENVKKSV